MRIKIILLLLFTLLPGVILAGEAKVLSISGEVEVRATREGQWVPAREEMEIAEGGALRTGARGGAVLLMPNKTKVWFRKSTSIEIEQRQTLSSRLMLAFGKIKVRVPHLLRKERFEVRTPAAVCAVRGTEFTMGSSEEGKMDLQVLFGEVKLKFTVPPQKGSAEFSVPQGHGLSSAESGKAVKPVLLTVSSEREALENWNPGLKPEERQRGLQQKENDRAQIKDFAKATNNSENSIKSFLNVVKESDLEAGRTLSDIHGNVVRVDQRMVRPDGRTIQFMNLVKRPNYAAYTNATAASASYGFKYYGGAVANRLDYMQMNMGFDAALPARIEEWPAFFSSNSIDPTYASFIMAQKEAGGIFFIAQPYRYIASRDELINNEQVLGKPLSTDEDVFISGFLAAGGGVSASEALNRIARIEVADAGANDGTLKYTADNTAVAGNVRWAQRLNTLQGGLSYSKSAEDAGSDRLWNFNADVYGIGGLTGDLNKVWLAAENYVINNGGGMLSKGDITRSGKDPFTLLKSIAGETIFSVKSFNAAGGTTYAKIDNNYGGDKFGPSNIDLVFIPDLMVAAVQRMLPAITNLGN